MVTIPNVTGKYDHVKVIFIARKDYSEMGEVGFNYNMQLL